MHQRFVPAVVAFIVFCAGWMHPVHGAVDPAKVEQAIKKGVKHLYEKQSPEGHWEKSARRINDENAKPTGKQWGGATSMAVYALLAAGESPQDPRLQKAINFLANADIEGTYALGMRAQIWQYLPQTPGVRGAIQRDAVLLMANLRTQGNAQGLYHYGKDGKDYDHSCSNYGVLGMWALAASNFEVPTKYWEMVDAAWRNHQMAMGAWCYNSDAKDGPNTEPRMSMTAAAVATLFITQEYLYGMVGVNCQGNIFDQNVERALSWMGANFNKPWAGGHGYYTLYNIERVGVASGYKYFDKFDWYQFGAEKLLKEQKPDGSWPDMDGEWKDIPNTVWAIVFLVRGRAPVMINKLDYTPTAAARGSRVKTPLWNQRPRDVANIVRWTGKQIERNLNWQIVNFNAPVEDLHDAPILYLSGKDAVQLGPKDELKLKQFIEQGGLILANSDCKNGAFVGSIKNLGSKLFGQEFRPLPEEHVIFTNEQYKAAAWKDKPTVLGLSNGVRELMILLPDDPARGWQTQAFSGAEREPQAQVAANIFLYSVDKQNLRTKGETYVVTPDPKKTPTKTLAIARLQHGPGSGWDPEPGGWRRLAAVLQNERQIGLKVEPVKLGAGKLDKSYTIAHLTGVTRLKLGEKERSELKKYIEQGGTLVIDAAGGNQEFAIAAQAELAALFPNARLGTLPLSHPMYSSNRKITEVEYRSFARRMVGNTREPRVQGIEIGGRTAVYFSSLDLSAGLVGQPVDGIFGYAPVGEGLEGNTYRAGATEIMGNIILFAGKIPPPPPPTTKPAEKAKK